MADTDDSGAWESNQPQIKTGMSVGTEQGRNDSPIRSLIQEDLQSCQVDESDNNTEPSSDGGDVNSSSFQPISPDVQILNSNEASETAEDMELTRLGASNDTMLDVSSVIYRHRTPSTDPSITLDSGGVMNASVYSNSSAFTGTLKRGKKNEIVELQLTPAEVERFNRSTMCENADKRWMCNRFHGPHIVLLSVIYIPLALLSSLCMNLYLCTVCWYNVYLCLSEERTIWHKIFCCPVLVLFFPLIILLIPLGVSLYGCVVQVSWNWLRWRSQIVDFEKGFYTWLCHKICVPECSPYEVIIINESVVTSINDSPVTAL